MDEETAAAASISSPTVLAQETPIPTSFTPPTIHNADLLTGASYAHYTPLPPVLTASESAAKTPCCMGIDEAGRGPVLGPMVYSALYLPLEKHRSLLADTYHFDDSKVLTPGVRSNLMGLLCRPSHPLHEQCGFGVKVMSARDISSGMLRSAGMYNLNAQAMDATVEIIKGVLAQGVNVTELYVDTIGQPGTYQKKLERVFPNLKITVAKKADSLFPCVSAASVVAKVTRDVALEVMWEDVKGREGEEKAEEDEAEKDAGMVWGSGYPSDARCVSWLKKDLDPIFGWGTECRFSWGTVKDMMDGKGPAVKVDWPTAGDEDTMNLSSYFGGAGAEQGSELRNWYGSRVAADTF